MTIRSRVRAILLVLTGLAVVVAGVLWFTDQRIDREMEQALQADEIQNGVYELFTTTRTYLSYGEEAARVQWEARFASLRSLVEETIAHSETESEHLGMIAESARSMEALFHQMVASMERRQDAEGGEAATSREVSERLASRLIGRGQVMSNHAVLFALASHKELIRVRQMASVLIFAAVLLALGTSGLLSLLLDRDLMADLRELQRGTEIIAAGDLDHRVGPRRTEELDRLADAFNSMTTRRLAAVKEREALIVRLEQSNRELEDFAFVASHDLQEPLRKIRTFGDLLEQKWGDRLDADGRDYLARMRSAAGRMQALIHALLQYSRIATKPEPASRVALGPLVREVLSDLSIPLGESRGSVAVGELPTVVAGPVQMRQLFQNLLGNSLKFRGDAPPEIRVWASPAPRGPWVEIRVQDNGIGFDQGYLPRLFQPFSRLQGRSEYEGTGMGLAICRRIVERHGGTITATSAPGRGSTFTVLLPLEPAAGHLQEETP